MTRRAKRIGIIAEDNSDVDSCRILISRIANNDRIGIKRSVGKGCGRIRRKCNAWAVRLKERGCSLLVLIHDLDNNNLADLIESIRRALNPCPIPDNLICIPVQEFEAWLLSDPHAIKTALKLAKIPKVKGMPETINSPKEHLGVLIYRASNSQKIYMNTEHNSKISSKISTELILSKCPSFKPFYDFIQLHFN